MADVMTQQNYKVAANNQHLVRLLEQDVVTDLFDDEKAGAKESELDTHCERGEEQDSSIHTADKRNILRTNDGRFYKIILKNLDHLRRHQLLCDVIFEVENQNFPAHKAVMASCSDFCRKRFLIKKDENKQCNEKEVVSLNDISAKTFKNLLEFVYTGDLSLTTDLSHDLLKAAQFMGIEALEQKCLDNKLPNSDEATSPNIYTHLTLPKSRKQELCTPSKPEEFVRNMSISTSERIETANENIEKKDKGCQKQSDAEKNLFCFTSNQQTISNSSVFTSPPINQFQKTKSQVSHVKRKCSEKNLAIDSGEVPAIMSSSTHLKKHEYFVKRNNSNTENKVTEFLGTARSIGHEPQTSPHRPNPVTSRDGSNHPSRYNENSLSANCIDSRNEVTSPTVSSWNNFMKENNSQKFNEVFHRNAFGELIFRSEIHNREVRTEAQKDLTENIWSNIFRKRIEVQNHHNQSQPEPFPFYSGLFPLGGITGSRHLLTTPFPFSVSMNNFQSENSQNAQKIFFPERNTSLPSRDISQSLDLSSKKRRGPYSDNICLKSKSDELSNCSRKRMLSTPVGLRKQNHSDSTNMISNKISNFRERSASLGSSSIRMKNSDSSKPYSCPLCDANFNRPANLKTHMRIHSGEKPYKCDTCGARFVQVAHLRAHVLIHTGEKPYPCTVCGTSFRHLQTLKSHLRIHTGEKPYSCGQCSVQFRHKSQLRLHLRTKHGIQTNTKKTYKQFPGLCNADISAHIKRVQEATKTQHLTKIHNNLATQSNVNNETTRRTSPSAEIFFEPSSKLPQYYESESSLTSVHNQINEQKYKMTIQARVTKTTDGIQSPNRAPDVKINVF